MDPHNPLQPSSTEPSPGPIESNIAPKAFEKRQPVFDPTGRVESINAYETKVADIRRHPFGLFVIYVQVIVALGLSFGLIFFLLPGVLETLGLTGAGTTSVIVILAFLVMLLGLLFLFLATRIYQASQLIVTDIHVTQVAQIGIFNRKVSELAMHSIEDVTAQQKGLFPLLFNYGTLHVETAGEQDNFIFIYCPNPNAYAKALLDARAEYLDARH